MTFSNTGFLAAFKQVRGEVCPDDGIYCHFSRYGATYSYRDVRRNIIASPDLFAQRIVGHPFKFESHRLNSENSEDALSWNVFRSLQEAGLLAAAAKLMTGEDHPQEPELYLWGIRVSDDSFEPWDLLIAARSRFESNLPVKRPKTEPDIALHLPGKYLILTEAKFTSSNPVYERGPRKDSQSLTFEELLGIYWDDSLRVLNLEKALAADHVHYQFWRNMVFADWMSSRDSSGTEAYHVNLTPQHFETISVAEFGSLLNEKDRFRFQRKHWESLGYLAANNIGSCSGLVTYLTGKTASLNCALRL